MATGRLILKRELAATPPVAPSGPFTAAQVWVDVSVYHLDSTFTYLIPGNLASNVKIGSFVLVPFNGRDITALVVELAAPESLSGLKSITKVIGDITLVTPVIIEVIKEASARYAAHPFDIIRSAIPDRAVAIEKRYLSQRDLYRSLSGSGKRTFLQLPPYKSRTELIAIKVKELSQDGGVLIILPDTSEVGRLSAQLTALHIDHSCVDSAQAKSENFESFLKARLGAVKVVIGTRSAVFAPVSELKNLIVYNDGSEHFYERRSPGWNVRDIALLRARHEGFHISFAGYTPSAELARLIDQGWIQFKRSKSKVRVNIFPQTTGELLPSRAISPIKGALAKGPVLFVVPLKGYAQAIRCAQCKTISRCECGGAHEKKTLSSPISCNHCLKTTANWKCIWCKGERPSMQSRGIERHAHELGLLFPGVATVVSTADHRIRSAISHGIVIATPELAPLSTSGYSAVVILEGNRFLNQPDMRAGDRVREMFFSHAALVSSDGFVALVQDEGHLIATSLTTWNPMPAIARELEERATLTLPPYVRSIKLIMDSVEITRLEQALSQARDEDRIPSSTKILGPIHNGEKAALILTVDVAQGDELISTIHEFMRRRSVAKKSLPSLRIDPYSLSH